MILLLCAGFAHAAPAAPSGSGREEAPAAQAQAVPAEEETDVHSQVASFAVTRLHDTPAVVTAITADEIRASGARDLMDILLLVPGFFFGVDVQGTIGPGFRGLWGQEGKVLLLIDGKEMNEQLYSTMQLGHEFPVELVERVEVVRGPGSVIYGGNAELAVVNVITRGAQGSTDLLISGTYGLMDKSYGRRGMTASGRYVFEDVPGLSVFASASLSDGQRSDAIYKDFLGNEASMVGASALNTFVAQAGIGYRDLQLSVLYHRLSTTSLDGFDEVLAAPAVADFESLHAEASYAFRPSEQFEIIPRFNFTLQEPYRDSNPQSDFYYDKRVTRLRGRLVARWAPLEVLQLTGGADVAFDQGTLKGPAGSGLQTAFPGDATEVAYQNYAGFLEAYSENPIVTVVAGARYEHHSAFGDSFVPRLVLLKSFGAFSGKALVSRAFRAPGVENISLGDQVRPERTTVIELEGSFRITDTQSVSLNAFDVGVQEPIIYSYDPVSNTEAYRNLGRLGSRGLEFDYRIRGGWGRAELTYAFYTPSDTDVVDYQVPGHPESFIGMPAHKATLTGTARVLPWLSISPTAVLLGPRYAVGAPDEAGVSAVETIPTQLLLNLFVRAENVGTRGLEIGAGVYNVLGADFRVAQPYNGGHAPLPVLSREFLVKLTYYFEPGAIE